MISANGSAYTAPLPCAGSAPSVPPRRSELFLSEKLHNVVEIDADDQKHGTLQTGRCLPVADAPIDQASNLAAGDTEKNHAEQDHGIKHGQTVEKQDLQRACDLAEHDDKQAVLRGGLCRHGEKQAQRCHIERAAADPQKSAEHSQHQTDRRGDGARRDVP